MDADISDSNLKKRKILSLFLSYGHKESDKVELIKNGLAKLGYKNVWLDIEKISPGAVWRREIVEGIRNCDVFIAFLSKYSMRDPGVCRDEVQISVGLKGGNIKTVLLEPLEEILPPATIAHTQWLDLHDWNGDEEKLPEILEKISKMVESKENYYLEDEVDLLRRIMNPISCEGRIKELNSRQMFGREWLYEALRKWDEANRSNVFWISGGAGFGKSMFSANLCFKMSEKVVAAHFVEWNSTEKNDASGILKSLAFQLARRYADYRKFIMALPEGAKHKLFMDECEPDILCDRLFCEEAGRCIDGGHESVWVLIDALDEATKNGRNPVAAMIAQYRDRFPKWMKFIITSRNDDVVRTTLGSMNPNIYDLDEKISRYQKLDMMDYLAATLAERRFSEAAYHTLVEKSEGMFLYLRYACETILAENLKEWQVKDLPQGITGIYEAYFKRHFGEDNYPEYRDMVRPILQIYSAAYEILPLDFFAEVMRCGTENVKDAVARLGTLKNERRCENGKESFQLCHKSVWDWLISLPSGVGSFRVSREEGLKKLTDFCLQKIKEYKMEQIVKDPNCEYPLRYVISHLVDEKNEQSIWELLGGTDPQLPKLQYDYFGSYAASVSSLKTAILFYMDLCNSGLGKKSLILPKIARLMVTYLHLQSEQQKDLPKIFHQGNSLETTLDYMASIKDVKVYFIIGCYLLTKVKENQWKMDDLITAIEKKCGDQIDSIDSDDLAFLGHGVLSQVAKDMTAEQMIRLLKNIGRRYDATSALDSLKEHLNLPQTARTYWYFDKIQDSENGNLGDHAKLSEEKERIGRIEGADDRCGELIKLATNLYVHEKRTEAEQLLGEAVKLLKEADSRWRLQEAAELYWNMGKTIEAGRLILDHHEIYGTFSEADFINNLCKFGLPKEAFSFFEKYILPKPGETADFLKKCVSPVTFMQAMVENGQSGRIKDLSNRIEIATVGFIDILETMIRCGAVNDAAELLKMFCSQKKNKDCLFKNPKLLVLMRQLKDSGAWTEEIPDEKELKEKYLANNSLETVGACYRISSPAFTSDFQIELIQDGMQCFLNTMKNPDLSAEDKADSADTMRRLLTENSSGLRDKLAPFVRQYLEQIKDFSHDDDFFIRTCGILDYWMTDDDSLLNDTLDNAAVDEFAAWYGRKLTENIESEIFDDNVNDHVQALLQYFLSRNQQSLAEALLNMIPDSDSGKIKISFDALGNILTNWNRRQKPQVGAQSSIPDNFAEAVDFVCRLCSPKKTKLGDIGDKIAGFYEHLKSRRENPEAVRIGKHIWQILDAVFQKTRFKFYGDQWSFEAFENSPLDGAVSILKEGGWCIPEEQFHRWCSKIQKWKGEDDFRKVGIEIQFTRINDSENPPENWYASILGEIAKVTDPNDKRKLLLELLPTVISKGSAEQQQDILARLTDRELIAEGWHFRKLDLEKLYRSLTGGNVSDNAIHCIVKEIYWKDLPFEKLCLIAPHMLDEKEYMEKWFDLLFRKLHDDKEFETMQKIASECPELGLSDFCVQPETPAAGDPLTAEKVAGMIPPKSELILSLRKQLADEELTPKGYAKKLGELLAPLPEETRQKYAELERSLNEGDITEKGFVKQLAELLG